MKTTMNVASKTVCGVTRFSSLDRRAWAQFDVTQGVKTVLFTAPGVDIDISPEEAVLRMEHLTKLVAKGEWTVKAVC